MPTLEDYEGMKADGERLQEVARGKGSGDDLEVVEEIGDRMVRFSSQLIEQLKDEKRGSSDEESGDDEEKSSLSDEEKDGLIIALEKKVDE